MNYYVNIKHPITGETIQAVPTGATRTTNGGGTEAEGRVITPKSNLETIWFTKEQIV